MKGNIITLNCKRLMDAPINIEIGVGNTVNEMKALVGAKIQSSSHGFHLIYSRQTLKPIEQLCHYGIKDGDTVFIVMSYGHICRNECITPGTKYYHAPPYKEDPEL